MKATAAYPATLRARKPSAELHGWWVPGSLAQALPEVGSAAGDGIPSSELVAYIRCGVEVVLPGERLRRRKGPRSCGCLRRENPVVRATGAWIAAQASSGKGEEAAACQGIWGVSTRVQPGSCHPLYLGARLRPLRRCR